MVTLDSSRKPSWRLRGLNAASRENFNAQNVGQTAPDEEMIIAGSFNGLLDRVAKIDFFDVWLSGSKILKKTKEERIEATMPMTEVITLTGLINEDIEFFIWLRLISVVEAGEDPLLSFKDVFCLVKIFERFFGEGVICSASLPHP